MAKVALLIGVSEYEPGLEPLSNAVDDWREDYNNAPTDGSAWLGDNDNQGKLLRGDSWQSSPVLCRSAHRYYLARDLRHSNAGFRVCLVRSQSPRLGYATLHPTFYSIFAALISRYLGCLNNFSCLDIICWVPQSLHPTLYLKDK